jgi:hypothetical protein
VPTRFPASRAFAVATRFHTSRAIGILAAAATLCFASPAQAQESDVLTGRVTTGDGRPLVGARVEAVSAETEITRTGVTDGNGRYLILFPDGGGRYLLRFSYIGMAEVVQAVVREAEEELLVRDVTMQTRAVELDPINVAARRPPPGDARAGEQSLDLSQELLNRLPLADLDPATLALMAAGVVGTGLDSLSGRAGFSVAGMSDLLNQVTLDGVVLGNAGPGVPEDGMRRSSVTTSTFDASRGGFAGGAVSMTTARGTNRSGGAFTTRYDSDALQSTASATTNAFARQQFGGSYGGPISSNRLFYNGALQFSRNTQHRFALSAGDPLAELRSGVASDSIARFLDILDTRYGLSTFGQTGPYNQQSDDLRLQGRMDWNIVQERTRSHTLSVRANASRNSQDSTRISQLDLLQRGGDTERNSALVAASLTSRFRSNWTNTATLSFSESTSRAVPFLEMPEGRIRVTSDFEDGTRQTSSLAFGGNRSMPAEAYSRDIQLATNLSLLQPVRNQLHRFKLGGSLQYTKDVSRSTDNLFGTFTYASLEDFLENRPERYERALGERQSRTGALLAGVYVGDTWRISNPLELTVGLRWDRASLDQTPAYNPAVEQRFGLRTDVAPVAHAFSPRLGFNYRLNREGQPVRALSGGVGVFAGRAPTGIFSSALRQTGLPDAEQRLACIGDAVPLADWARYAADPMSAPATCADGSTGLQATSAPNVIVISPEQSLPASWRAELGYRTALPLQLTGNVRYTYSRGVGLWGYRDRNLDESRSFELAGEGRPFFGDASAIVGRTGATSLAASRLHEEFGNVYEVVTDRESEAHVLTAAVNGWVRRRLTFNLNYTLGFARDQGSSGVGIGGFGMGGIGGGMAFGVPTAGSPNDVEWATSSSDRRHTLNLMLSYPVRPWAEVSVLTRLSSGSPFTPMVNRDINGDGMRNDRAFIFDPALPATDPAVAEAMSRLLATSSGRVRDCLAAQLGAIAGTNSCRNSWTQALDVRASLRPVLPAVQRRLTLAADFGNVLTGLDQLINGRNNMRGWGEGQRADPNLLEVRGFDPARNAFAYEVNEGFGRTRRGPNAFRNAFSVTLSGRIAVGGNPLLSNSGFGTVPGMIAGGFEFGTGTGGGGTMVVVAQGGDPGALPMIDHAAMGGGAIMMIRGAEGEAPIVMGGAGGMGEVIRLFGARNPGADSVLATIFFNPVADVLALADSLELTAAQRLALSAVRDTLAAQHGRRRAVVEPIVRQLSDAIGDGRPTMPVLSPMREPIELRLVPNVQGARREAGDAMLDVEQVLQPGQWERLPERLRTLRQQVAAAGAPASINFVGIIDRMLANPLPVLLELRDTLGLSAAQVAAVEAVSARLDAQLVQRREEIGRRFDGVPPDETIRVFQLAQPDIERGRNEVRAALGEVERILTRAQWNALPPRLRDPFAMPAGGVRLPGG